MQTETIARIELTATETGKPVVELYSTNTALQFPVLRLFDLSMLADVGIDPNALEVGTPVHKRFLASYTESEKINGHGNAYRDVQELEPITPASAAPLPASALDEILSLVQAIAAHLGIEPPPLGLSSPPAGDDPHPPPAPKPPDPSPGPVDPTTGEIDDADPALRFGNRALVGDSPAILDPFLAFVAANGTIPANLAALHKWDAAQGKEK